MVEAINITTVLVPVLAIIFYIDKIAEGGITLRIIKSIAVFLKENVKELGALLGTAFVGLNYFGVIAIDLGQLEAAIYAGIGLVQAVAIAGMGFTTKTKRMLATGSEITDANGNKIVLHAGAGTEVTKAKRHRRGA